MSKEYVEIPLTQGFVTVIDAEDFERVSQFKWCANKQGQGRKPYAVRSVRINGKKQHIRLHRFVLGVTSDMEVDHANRDTLDNRKENLRVATRQQNSCNKLGRLSSSGYRGVQVQGSRFYASIKHNGKTIGGGCFVVAVDAARAYDALARKFQGEFAVLNFPELGKQLAAMVEIAGLVK